MTDEQNKDERPPVTRVTREQLLSGEPCLPARPAGPVVKHDPDEGQG